MKKRILLSLLLALCFALLLTACSGEKEMKGMISEYLQGENGVNAFLMETNGEVIGVRLTDASGIYSSLASYPDEAILRNAEYPDMEVTVTGEKADEKLTTADGTEVPTYMAKKIIIDSIPVGEPLTLKDGTTVNTRLNREGLSYFAPDGMMLLQIYNQVPGEYFVDRVDVDIVSDEVQAKLYLRYQEQRFDDIEQTERAWAEYCDLGKPKDFRAYVARQVTSTSFYNDRVIFYYTDVTLSRNVHRYYYRYYNEIIDRETGEQVSFWELFKPSESEMREWISKDYAWDPELQSFMAENFDPSWVHFGLEGVTLYIPWDALPNDKGPVQGGGRYYTNEEFAAMLQDWVLPLQETHPIPELADE